MADQLTNNTSGPKAVNTTKGQVILAPGETLADEHEVTDAERAALQATGFLDSDVNSGVEPASHSQMADMFNSMGVGGAGGAGPAMGTGAGGPPDGQTAEQLKDANTEAQLREIADTEQVDLNGAASKLDIAQRIVDKRNAG